MAAKLFEVEGYGDHFWVEKGGASVIATLRSTHDHPTSCESPTDVPLSKEGALELVNVLMDLLDDEFARAKNRIVAPAPEPPKPQKPLPDDYKRLADLTAISINLKNAGMPNVTLQRAIDVLIRRLADWEMR